MMNEAAAPFALLDDNATPGGFSRLYENLIDCVHCDDAATLDAAWAHVQAHLAQGRFVVVLAEYEWGEQLLLGLLGRAAPGRLSFLIFASLQRLDAAAVDAFLLQAAGDEQAPGVLSALAPSIARDDYARGVQAVQESIRNGATYQVNYTYRLHGAAFGNVVNLYRQLRARQRVAYGALLRVNPAEFPFEWVLSRSPELFVEHKQGVLRARPMKGTATAGPDEPHNQIAARWLRDDPKNRAENLMIVDLLRSDLGRISTIGSVKVPALFSVERYANVLQMTSTVESQRARDARFPDVLRALFPCGSITGAPKIETMKIIRALESTPRGLYTGSIGWIDPSDAVCPDFCLSVAIRTLTLSGETAGQRTAVSGTGGGIVIDSEIEAEFEETRSKYRFLAQLDPGFVLIETMKAVDGQVPLLALHLDRVSTACAALGFNSNRAAIDAALRSALQALDPNRSYRIRLTVNSAGDIAITHTPFVPAGPDVALILAQHMLSPTEAALAQFKTSYRPTYSAELQRAEACGAFDAVFVDARGYVTEGARSNLFARIDGCWITPRLRPGVLPGVMRGVLLQDAQLQATEGELSLDELRGAESLMVCNAVQGALSARLIA